MELNDDAIWIADRHEPAEVAFGGRGVWDPGAVQRATATRQVVGASDVECEKAEAAQRASGLRL